MGSTGASPVAFGALAEHSSTRGLVPVGEAPTGAAEAAALPIPIAGSREGGLVLGAFPRKPKKWKIINQRFANEPAALP